MIRTEVSDDIDQILRFLTKYDARGFDCYHCISSFNKDKVWNEKKINKKTGDAGAYSTRVHSNVKLTGSLALDIDTQESHANAKYKDRGEAWNALGEFCGKVRLPFPLVVSSGGGLHSYWPLMPELPPHLWRRLAFALKYACQGTGLAADPSRTTDLSSILRTPGTHHHKSGQIVTVIHAPDQAFFEAFAFEHLEKIYGHALPPPASVGNPKPSQPPAPPGAGGHGILGSMRGVDYCDVGAIARHCQQVAQFERDPSSLGEPGNYAIAGVFAQLGEPGWTRFVWKSRGYKGNTDAESDAWCLDALRRAGEFNGATCGHIEAQNPKYCVGCPHKGKISTPIQFARQWDGGPTRDRGGVSGSAQEGGEKVNGHASADSFVPHSTRQITLPPLPLDQTGRPSWEWHGEALVQASETKDGKPSNRIVSDHPIWLDGVYRHEVDSTQEVYVFLAALPKEELKSLVVPAGDVKTNAGIVSLTNQGANIRDVALFRDYLTDAVTLFNNTRKRTVRYEQCGWKHADSAFLLGGDLYNGGPEVVTTRAVLSHELSPRTQWLGKVPGADTREWLKIVNELYAHDNYAAHFALFASFGAVLMKLHNPLAGGCILNYVGPTGTGKTIMLNAAASVWGQWKGMAIEHYDTPVARAILISNLANLPVIMDEIALLFRKENPELLRDFCMMISLGEDRKRGEQTGKGVRYAAGTWCTIVIGGSNEAIKEKLSVAIKGTDAALQRVLELRWPGLKLNPHEGLALANRLVQHTGAPGDAFLRHLLRDDVLQHAKGMLRDAYKEITHKVPQQFRIQADVITCAYGAGQLLQQMGLTSADPLAVTQWAVAAVKDQLPSAVPEGVHHDAVDAIDGFLRDHYRDILYVPFPFVPGTPAIEIAQVPTRLLGRFEKSSKRLFLPTRELKTWLIQNGYSWGDTIKSLKEARVFVAERRTTLTAGTVLAAFSTQCMEFDLSVPYAAGIAATTLGDQPA